MFGKWLTAFVFVYQHKKARRCLWGPWWWGLRVPSRWRVLSAGWREDLGTAQLSAWPREQAVGRWAVRGSSEPCDQLNASLVMAHSLRGTTVLHYGSINSLRLEETSKVIQFNRPLTTNTAHWPMSLTTASALNTSRDGDPAASLSSAAPLLHLEKVCGSSAEMFPFHLIKIPYS